MLRYSPLLDRFVEFYTGAGTATSERKEQGGVTAGTRALESAYTPQDLKPEYFPTGRKLMGEQIRVDVAYELMGSDIPSEFLAQLRRGAIGLATLFNDVLINGDPTADPDKFAGLKKLVLNSQIVPAATNGLEVLTGSDNAAKKSQQEFMEKIDEAVALCNGINKVIVMNSRTEARLTTVARGFINWTETTFGKKIALYNGVPLLNIEQNGNVILPFDETQGTANDTCSLYVASFEEKAGLSFFTTKQGLKVYQMSRQNNFYESHVDFIADSSLFRDKAIVKLQGLKFS
jgi:hypothetical protein